MISTFTEVLLAQHLVVIRSELMFFQTHDSGLQLTGPDDFVKLTSLPREGSSLGVTIMVQGASSSQSWGLSSLNSHSFVLRS